MEVARLGSVMLDQHGRCVYSISGKAGSIPPWTGSFSVYAVCVQNNIYSQWSMPS